MDYKIIPPPSGLSHIVRSFWTLEGAIDNGCTFTYRLFADACPNLVFSYHNLFSKTNPNQPVEYYKPSIIHGQTDQFEDLEVKGRFGIVGVYLYPAAIPLLLNMPSPEITNEIIDLTSLLGQEGEELEEKVMLAPDNNTRVRLISDLLLQKLKQASHKDIVSHFCIESILKSKGDLRVNEMAETVNLSRRQLERKFLQSSGLSPKLFSRITRFRNVIRLSNNTNVSSLTTLAYEAGYSDQSHFIREFKEFSGYSPKHYFKSLLASADTFVEMSPEYYARDKGI